MSEKHEDLIALENAMSKLRLNPVEQAWLTDIMGWNNRDLKQAPETVCWPKYYYSLAKNVITKITPESQSKRERTFAKPVISFLTESGSNNLSFKPPEDRVPFIIRALSSLLQQTLAEKN